MSSHGLGLLLFAFLWGMAAFAVAIDASRRGRHGGFWGVVTFLTGLFGLVVYGLVVMTTSDPDSGRADDDSGSVRVCPECATRHADTPNFCGECGTELGPEDDRLDARRREAGSRWYCSNCSSRVGRETDDCPNCGAVF